MVEVNDELNGKMYGKVAYKYMSKLAEVRSNLRTRNTDIEND